MTIIARDSESPERIPVHLVNLIDNLVHSSTLQDEEKTRIENEADTMTEDEAICIIQYLKENQKESLNQQWDRAIKNDE